MKNFKKLLGILILMFAFTTGVYAESPDFTIEVLNETEVKTMTDVLNAVSMILYSNASNGPNMNYDSLLRLMFLFGSFLVFSNVVFAASGHLNGLQSYVKYNAVVVAILTFIYSNTATVMVTTNNISGSNTSCNPTSVRSTDFVVLPYTLAYGIKVMDAIGTQMTHMFETAMYQPEGTFGTPAILDGGYAQNLKATADILSIFPSDVPGYTDLSSDISMFLNECVAKGLYSSGVGRYEVDTMYKSNNIYKYITSDIIGSSNAQISSRMDAIIVPNSNYIYMSCRELWTNHISKTKITDMINEHICSSDKAFSVEGSFEYLMKDTLDSQSGVYSNSKDLIIQAAMLNSASDSRKSLALDIQGAEYAVGKTKAEMAVNGIIASNYMMEVLPQMTILFKSLIFAVFPFILLLMVLPGGTGIFKQYLKSVLWIQMWMPTAAILNYFIYGYTEAHAQVVAANGLTSETSASLLSGSASLAGIAGLLYLSIPAVSWLFLTGSAQMIGNLTGQIGGSILKHQNTDAVANDMKSLKASQTASKLSGKDMSIAETETYNAQIAGSGMAAQIVANQNTGGMEQGAKRKEFEETANNTSTNVQMKNMTAGAKGNLNASKPIQNLTEARSNKTMNGDKVDVDVTKEFGKKSGTTQSANLNAYLDKFDQDGNRQIDDGKESSSTQKFEELKATKVLSDDQANIDVISKNADKNDNTFAEEAQRITEIDKTKQVAETDGVAKSFTDKDGNTDLDKLENHVETTTQAGLEKSKQLIKTIGGDEKFIDLKKKEARVEGSSKVQSMKVKEDYAKRTGSSIEKISKTVAGMSEAENIGTKIGQSHKHSESSMVEQRKAEAVKSEREKIADVRAKDTQMDNVQKGGLGMIDDQGAIKLDSQQKEMSKLENQRDSLDKNSKNYKKDLSKVNQKIASLDESINQNIQDSMKRAESRMMNNMADSSGSALTMIAMDDNGKYTTMTVSEEGLKQYVDTFGGDLKSAAKSFSSLKDASLIAGMVGTFGAVALGKKFLGGAAGKGVAQGLKNIGKGNLTKDLKGNVKKFDQRIKDIDKNSKGLSKDQIKAQKAQALKDLEMDNKKSMSSLNDLKKSNEEKMKRMKVSGKTNTAEYKDLDKQNKGIDSFKKEANSQYKNASKNVFAKKSMWKNAKNMAVGGAKIFSKANVVGAVAGVTVEQGMDAHRNMESIADNADDTMNEHVIGAINSGNFDNLNGKITRIHSNGYMSNDSHIYRVSHDKNSWGNEITLTTTDGEKETMSAEAFSNLYNKDTGYATHVLNEFKGMEIGSDSLNDNDFDATVRLAER